MQLNCFLQANKESTKASWTFLGDAARGTWGRLRSRSARHDLHLKKRRRKTVETRAVNCERINYKKKTAVAFLSFRKSLSEAVFLEFAVRTAVIYNFCIARSAWKSLCALKGKNRHALPLVCLLKREQIFNDATLSTQILLFSTFELTKTGSWDASAVVGFAALAFAYAGL